MKKSHQSAGNRKRPPIIHREGDEFVGMDIRLGSFFGLLIVGMLLCIHGIPYFIFYPAGLTYSFLALTGRLNTGWGEGGLVLGYLIYLVLLVATFALPLKKHFRIIFSFLIIFTLMNVAGCHIILRGLSHIGK